MPSAGRHSGSGAFRDPEHWLKFGGQCVWYGLCEALWVHLVSHKAIRYTILATRMIPHNNQAGGAGLVRERCFGSGCRVFSSGSWG